MKNLLIFTCFLALFTTGNAQNFNLKGLKSINVVVIDSDKILAQDYINGLIVNSNIALAQTGIKITDKNNQASLQIKINAVISESFADPRISIRFNLLEKVEMFRAVGKVRSEAITYQTFSLFVADRINISKKVSDMVLNSHLPTFLNAWLKAN